MRTESIALRVVGRGGIAKSIRVAPLLLLLAGGVARAGVPTPQGVDHRVPPALTAAQVQARYYADGACCTEQLECQDGLWCNGIEWCDCWGVCHNGILVNCDDGNTCTTDRCVADYIGTHGELGTGGAPGTPGEYGTGHCDNRCTETPPGCPACSTCTTDANCDDHNACTSDHCLAGSCSNNVLSCDDGSVCTTDSCDRTLGCQHVAVPHCCTSAADCDDSNFCTHDSCDVGSGTCTNAADTSIVCRSAVGVCDVADYCTATGACAADASQPSGTACTADAFTCTNDVCNGSGGCTHPVQAGKCLISGVCYNSGDPRPGNACQTCQPLVSQSAWTSTPDGSRVGCNTVINSCTSQACQGGLCLAQSNVGGPCDYSAIDPCEDPGVCLASGLCGPGPYGTPVNDLCAGVRNIPLDASGHGTASGTTACATHNYAGSCNSTGTAKDVTYYYTYTVPTDFQIYSFNIALSASYDSVLYARATCDNAGTQLNCNDDCASTALLSCATYGLSSRSSAFNMPGGPIGGPYTVNLIVDGYGTAAGAYTLIVDRIAQSNNPCWVNADGVRRVNATTGGDFRGNIVGYQNDILCDDGSWTGNRCDCGGGTNGCGVSLLGNRNNPARAWFLLTPAAATTYCIWSDETTPGANWFDTTIEIWDNTVPGYPGGCDGYVSDVTCSHIAGRQAGGRMTQTRIQITVPAGEVYMVGVSRYCWTSGCSCTPEAGSNYDVHFDIGACT